jgi:E3 ubiquitin-protein ligase TRIP12
VNALELSSCHSSFEDSKRSSPSLLARQLRLRLQADDNSDIPRNLHNIVVSIHAIATFQALHDYLRPRVAGLIGGGSRLSGMLAAIAGLGGPFGNLDNPPPKPSDSAPAGTSSALNTGNDGPRRSRRLSAKIAGGSGSAGNDDGPVNESGESSAQAGESTPEPQGETVYADFTDDEVDADVFDEEVEHDPSAGDKTVTLSVAEGMPYSL